MSGYKIVNNTFTNCHCAVFFGGGRRNVATNNLFHNCSLDVHIDDRGLTWQKEDCSPVSSVIMISTQYINYNVKPSIGNCH